MGLGLSEEGCCEINCHYHSRTCTALYYSNCGDTLNKETIHNETTECYVTCPNSSECRKFSLMWGVVIAVIVFFCICLCVCTVIEKRRRFINI